MWILIAQSLETDDSTELQLQPGERRVVGRSSRADWTIDWDLYLSRQHFEVTAEADQLHFRRLKTGRNSLQFRGEMVDECRLDSGDDFLVGGTVFRCQLPAVVDEVSQAVEEYSYHINDLQELNRVDEHNRLRSLEALPGLLNEAEGLEQMSRELLQWFQESLSEAEGIILLKQAARADEANGPSLEVISHVSRVNLPAPPVSRTLWNKASDTEYQAVLHVWSPDAEQTSGEYTTTSRYSWAYCLAWEASPHEFAGIYVYGSQFSGAKSQLERIQADICFANLAAQILAACFRGRLIDRQQVLLRQFFPAEALACLPRENWETALAPRETELVVLYCDLSRFTARTESHQRDLAHFMEQISRELSCATEAIRRHSGVIGDFHGDAVMGFWGWPQTLEPEEACRRACLTAVQIAKNFSELVRAESDYDHGGIRIGIATGNGMAGKLGSADQVKVTAVGPPVNIAARIQEACVAAEATILVESQVADIVATNPKNSHSLAFGKEQEIEVRGLARPLSVCTLNLAES